MLRLLCGLGLVFGTAGLAMAQPFNNNCAAAINILPGAPASTISSVNATTDGPAACGGIGADVWYRFTAPPGPNVSMAVDTCGSNFDTVMTVYQATACPVTAGQQVACDDDGAPCGTTPFRQSRVAFTATGGATYYFRIGGFNAATGNIVLNLGPANDSCAGAIEVGSGTFTGSNADAQTNGNLVCGSIGADLWYRWTAPSNVGPTTINTCGSNYDTVLAVYNAGTCPVTDAQNIACSDDDGTCGSRLSQVTFTPVAGQSYLIRIGGFQGATGNFQVNIQNSACFGSQPTIQGTPLTCGDGSTVLEIFGPAGATYDWRIDGAPFAIFQSVTFGPFPPGSRRVECIITLNGCGSYTTPPVTLVSAASPSVTIEADDVTLCTQSTASFVATATGANLTYQWFRNGQVVPGENSPTLSFQTGQNSANESILCHVSSACGFAESNLIIISVEPVPSVTQPLPSTLTICSNQPLMLTIGAANATRFNWERNGNTLSGQTSSTLNIPAPVPPGVYRSILRNDCTSTFGGNPCTVTVLDPVAVTAITPTTTVCQSAGQTSLTVTATGSGPLTFQWRRNNQVVQTGPSPTLAVNNQPSSNGEYSCTVSNACSSATSALTGFLVTPTSSITQQPAATPQFCFATNGSLSVATSGPTTSFQWQRNNVNLTNGQTLPGGTVISGVNTNTLTFTNVQFESSDLYRCLVTTPCSGTLTSATSAPVFAGPTLNVGPGQAFTTIQSAVNSLANCGKVLVMPGTYNERVNIGGKRVWLESTGGPAVTTINGGNSSDPVASTITSIFTSADDAAQVIKGFTITGGRGLVNGSSRLGGGIVLALPANAPTTPLIENCIIEGNAATSGGGLFAQGATAVRLVGTTIRNNQVVSTASQPSFGGAAYVDNCGVLADRCTFSGNSATGPTGTGGGVYIQNASVPSRFTNCLVTGNTASIVGGGLRFANAPVSIVNSTIAANQAPDAAELQVFFAQSVVSVANSIIRSTASNPISVTDGGTLTINRSNVQPGASGFTGSNNISTDPLFMSATDFRLGAGSPCIDAGDNALVPSGISLDLAGLPRYADDPSAPDTGSTGNGGGASIVDMGAFERMATPAGNCADAPSLLAGTYPFTTVGATTDGPDEGSFAQCGADPRLINDVWFRYTATCSGNASVSLCGSEFDTVLAIYRGAACPTTPGSIVACNDDSDCGFQSQITLAVTAGEVLLIRIAGFNAVTGTGTVTIACSVACPADFNGDGNLDPDDLADFIGAFFAQPAGPGSDFNNDGNTDPDDLADYIGAFFTGCE